MTEKKTTYIVVNYKAIEILHLNSKSVLIKFIIYVLYFHFLDICRRERCPVSFVGEVTGDGYMTLVEDSYTSKYLDREERLKPNTKSKLPYDLHLEAVLGMSSLFLLYHTNGKILSHELVRSAVCRI